MFSSSIARRWGWVLADGILGVLAGVAALFLPGTTLLVLAVVLGVVLLMQGVAQVAAAVGAHAGTTGRGWAIVLGILTIVAGVIVFVSPGSGLFVIAIGVAIWFFAAGINELIAAAAGVEGRAWNVIGGIISIIAGIIALAFPGTALATVALVVGILFLVRGIAEIGLALRLRSRARQG